MIARRSRAAGDAAHRAGIPLSVFDDLQSALENRHD
jgi:hypothetical protein